MNLQTRHIKPKPVDPKVYDKDYLLKYCHGHREFAKSGANQLPKRLERTMEVASFKKGQTILEIGCGRGEIAFHAAKTGCIVTAIDYSKDAVEITKKLISKLPNNLKRNVTVLKMVAFCNDYFDFPGVQVFYDIGHDYLVKVFFREIKIFRIHFKNRNISF